MSVFQNKTGFSQTSQLFMFHCNEHVEMYKLPVAWLYTEGFKNVYCIYSNTSGESFQDYSSTQDFEADFPWKVSLKMLN